MPRQYSAVQAAQFILTNSSDESTGDEEEAGDISDEEDILLEERNSESEESDGSAEVISDTFSTSRFTSKDGKIWSDTRRQDPRGRYSRCNILRETSGPSRRIRDSFDSPAEAFSCFFTSEIMDIILQSTNEEGFRIYADSWHPVDRTELEAYLGLILLAGVYRARSEPVINLWNRESGRPIFNSCMGRNRFQVLTRVLRFDSRTDRQERRQRDKMAPIRVLHDKMAALCRNNYKVGPQVCVDEQLVLFRGRCPFRVYIPSKPGKYGLKVWACCDVNTAYISNFELYTGITGHGREIGQASRVVLQMTDHLSGKKSILHINVYNSNLRNIFFLLQVLEEGSQWTTSSRPSIWQSQC